MGYTGGKEEIIWFLLVMLSFCVVAVNAQSNSEYGGWPDLTRRVPQKVDPPGCSYKAQKYQHGEQVETPEPCLNCTCIRAVLVCYLRVCPTAVAPPPGCFPAREPGHCCPTIVCGINDLIPQINGDKGSDSKNKTEAEDDDEEPELRPVFRPSTTTSEEDLITDEDIVSTSTDDSVDVGSHSIEPDKTTNEKSVSSTYTTVPKFQSTTDGEWTTDDTSKMQQGISSSSGPTIRLSVEPSSMELDESISKIPSTTWFSVPEVIVKETTAMEETPTSSESFDIDKFTTDIRESTGSERILSSTRTTSFDNVFVTEDTKVPDSLLFITSTTTSPHSDFGDYDFNFLNDIPGGCLVNGTLYGDGSAMLSSSFCEYCFCIRGKRTCLKPKCHLAIEGCAAKYDSEYTCCPSRYDCSERSTTSEATSWEIPSSEALTTLHENLDGFCLVDNKIYALGNVIPDYQTCHNCYCNDSNIVCNKISCSPPVDGCDPIIPEGHCCPISYRCDSPQTDPDEIETNNDIPAPNKLEVDARATTTEKPISTSLKQTIKSPTYQGSKINYSHKTKGHPKPLVPSSINYGVKTGNRKTPQIHRLKQPLVHSGQKTGGMKNLNAIHRRIDDSNATIDENGDFDLIEIDNDYEGYLLDHPENIDMSPESSLAVGNTYTESIARQSRHDTTIDEGVSKEYESDLTGSASSFVTKSLDENASTISSRENDKTLNIDDLDLESLIVSTMEAISAMSEFIPPNTTIKPESSSKYDEVSETYFPSMSWNDRDTSTFSAENPEVHTISLEELFKKFVMKARENMSESVSDAPEIKTDTSETVRNNSKRPIHIDEIQLQSSITNITKHVDKAHETTISETLNNNISKPMKNNLTENVTHNIATTTTTAENLETDKEENKGITHKDLIINFETHPISPNPTSKVPEPVYTHSTPSSVTHKDQGLPDSNTKLSEFQKDSKSDLYHIGEMLLAEKTPSTLNYDTTNIDVLTAATNALVSDKSENKSTSVNIDKDEFHQRINETTENSSSNVSTTSVQPDFTRGAIWTLVSSSAPTLITSSTDPTFPKATHNDLITETRLNGDISTAVSTATEFATTIPPILKPQTTSRKNSKLPIEILTVYEISKNAGNHSTPFHVFETTTDLGIKNSETTNKPRDIYSPETILGLTSTLPTSTKSSDSEIKTSTTLSDLHDNAHDRDNDYDYFSDDSLDDIDFLSKSRNEGVLEFLSGFTKSVPHLTETTETKEIQEQTTENLQETSTSQPEIISLQTTTTTAITTTTTTAAPENVGIVKIGAPISVFDNESIYNHSVISDNFESKSKVRTTESGGVIYMDPKYTDIKIEQPIHDEHEKVPMIPKATEVFELSSEASSQSSPSTDSLENRADADLSQLEKKKEPRIQDPASQSGTENRHPNSNYKVIPFVVADALKGSQNKSQSMLVVQDDTLTTQDVVSDFCFINGRIYINGEMVAKSDPCELCRCFYGRELCQLQRCPAPPAPDCVPEYLPGFCCPRLTCGKNGTPEKPGLEQLLAPSHRSPPVKSPVIHVSSANAHASHVKPTNSQVAQSLPVKPQVILGQRRPINSQASQQESTNQQRPSVVIQQQPPYRQGTPYRSPQQPDRFLIGAQNQKQANEVRPNLQLNLPAPPSNGNLKDEATPSSVKFGLRVRPPSTTWSQETSKWTTASTRVTRSTTIQRMSSPPYTTTTVSSTPPFRRQTTSTQTSSTQPSSTTTTASTTTSTTAKITQKPTTPTVVTLPTTAYEAAQNGFIDPWGLLKVSGCNIYGKFYNVNERVEVLSGPCSHCICAANGVECNDIC